MELVQVRLQTQLERRYTNSTRRYQGEVNGFTVTKLQVGDREAIGFVLASTPAAFVGQEHEAVYDMPQPHALCLEHFARKYYAAQDSEYDGTTFARYIAGVTDDPGVSPYPIGYEGYLVPFNRQRTPYGLYNLGYGTSDYYRVHDFIALPDQYCLCILGTNGPLIITTIGQLAEAYGVDKILRVDSTNPM